MDKRKWISRLLLILFLASVLLPISAFQASKKHLFAQWEKIESLGAGNRLSAFDCGCLYVADSHIGTFDGEHTFSLFPYAFYHSEFRWPKYGEDYFKYRAGYMWYSFTIDEVSTLDSAASASPIITFPKDAKGNRSRVYEKDHIIYTENDSKALFFHNRKKVCELPSENSFFDPIRINGIEGAGIVILSQDNPSKKSTVQVYIYTGGKWVQTQFQLPNQNTVSELDCYIRRHVDMDWASFSQNGCVQNLHPGVGVMEIGIENSDGSIALYSVTYADDELKVRPDDSHPPIPPEEWIY